MDEEIIPTAEKGSNAPEMSVSDLAFSLKKTLEETYGRVRVRGELSRVSIPRSGHMYSNLKDDNSVIDIVCWKGVLSKLSIQPEEGLEVICTGRITTYPARSNYQMIIESMELAGEGALLKMLEERKKKLAAEGLFDESRKKKLPFIPRTIGVITSPTGAVIRDIMHRLRDRFPSHVLLYPVLVQGKGAADQVAKAIDDFNRIDSKPDLLIVARGGGSLEDLMPFNEEIVVRAVSNSHIPIISAVGHETDTTLCDYAADLRAPTPTGAAEMAVPIRTELMAQITEMQKRMINISSRNLSDLRNKLQAADARLGSPERLFDVKIQKIDNINNRLDSCFEKLIHTKQNILTKYSASLRSPKNVIREKYSLVSLHSKRLATIKSRIIEPHKNKLDQSSRMLESLSFKKILQRGYTVIKDENGKVITKASQTKNNQAINIQFQEDKIINATIGKNNNVKNIKSSKSKPNKEENQIDLF